MTKKWTGARAAGALAGIVALAAASAVASAQCADPVGDITGDGATDVVDVQCAVLSALYSLAPELGGELLVCASGDPLAADVDCSAAVDVVDVSVAIVAALGTVLPEAIDGDGDLCPDACQLSTDPTDPGAPFPEWALQDFQPASPGFGQTYGKDGLPEGVQVVALLASW
jgi:hypothetical protein